MKVSTIASDPDLFVVEEAAKKIGCQRRLTEDQVKQLEKAMRAAIDADELGNYHYQTGSLIQPPFSVTAPRVVRIADVEEWLASPSYKARLRAPILDQPHAAPAVEVGTPVCANVETTTARSSNKTKETLKFERAVLAAMTAVWNAWKVSKVRDSTLKEPTKAEMYGAALNELLDGQIQGKRKKPNLSMVRDAAKSWQKPASMKVQISPALAPPKRHGFKGDK